MTLDLESLRFIGWTLLGAAMMGFVLCEGLSLGLALLLPILTKDEAARRKLISEMIAPIGLSNLAWLVALVVILFAAWPVAYAVSVSSFYSPLSLILVALLLRPVSAYFFDAVNHVQWRQYGFKLLVAGGWLPAALFGLLVGNLLKGIPFHLDSDMHIRFLGDFSGLFNLFSLLVAVTCLSMLAMHASVFLQLKTIGELQLRARGLAVRAAILFVVCFGATGLWITHLEGYHISSEIVTQAVSNPLAKFVKRGEGLWLDNFEHIPALWAVPVLVFMGAISALVLAVRDKAYWAMIASSFCLAMVVLTFGISMFPFLLPSNISLNSSLTIWDSSASERSLQISVWVAAVALPVIALYSRWQLGAVYKKRA